MNLYKPEWREEDKQRVLDMDRWYILDGRHLKKHKLHGLYTGLKEIGPSLDKKNDLEVRMDNAWQKLKR